jgi:di/tricarboxylate transporter
MAFQAWLAVATVMAVVGLLATTRVAPDLLLLGGVLFLTLVGVLSPTDALAGLVNQGMVTVALLFVVAAGVRETGLMSGLAPRLLGRPRSIGVAQLRLMVPVTLLSAFLNNTPVVAIFIPTVSEWARRQRLATSKLMIPLSYAAIIGGTCTMIGTSTNLIVNSLYAEHVGGRGLGLFEISRIGVPYALAASVFLVFASRWLLPTARQPLEETFEDPREYTVEMIVEESSPLIGRTIEGAGLRHLPGLYLIEIQREDRVRAAPPPTERLRAGDRLVFAGIVESVVDLRNMRGLVPAGTPRFEIGGERSQRTLLEAVVSDECELLGQTIRDGRFRSRYDAAVIAVARNGRRLEQKIGDITLQAGDALLLEAHSDLGARLRNNREFFLVSPIEGSTTPRHHRAGVALVILGVMVAAAAFGVLSMLVAAATAAAAMLVTGCLTADEARRAIDWQVLLAIVGAFGIGRALEITGAASAMADALLGAVGANPWVALAAVWLVTAVATEVITNNGAAVLVFPLAFATAERLGVSPMPFVIAIMMAASASFATPIGYQTNMMVYGPGGYRFVDFLRAGLPMALFTAVFCLLLIPRLWTM